MKKKRDNTKTTLQQEAEFILETAIQRADINKKELQKLQRTN